MRRILSLTFLLCLLLLPEVGSCSATYTVTAEQLTQLESNLAALRQNNEKLEKLYNQSQTDLKKAQQQSATLQEQVKSLQAQLATLKAQSEKASSSLQTASEDWQSAKTLYEKSEQEHQKTERRLKTQKTAWQLIAGGLLMYLAF